MHFAEVIFKALSKSIVLRNKSLLGSAAFFLYFFAQRCVPNVKALIMQKLQNLVISKSLFFVRNSSHFLSSSARILSRNSSISEHHLRGGDFLFVYLGVAVMVSAISRNLSLLSCSGLVKAVLASLNSLTYLFTVFCRCPKCEISFCSICQINAAG